MANIVFLVGDYYPHISATAKCADNVIQEIKKTHKVNVICYQNLHENFKCDGINIVQAGTRLMRFRKRINQKQLNPGKKQIVYKVLNSLTKVVNFASFLLRKDSVNRELVNNFYSAIKKCDAIEKVDVIIPVCFPFEGLVAAYEFKRKNSGVSLIPYLFDPFTDNETLHRFSWIKSLRYRKHKELEEDIYKHSDRVFVINHILKSPLFNENNSIQDKLVVTEHPVLIKPQYFANEEGKTNLINLTYTGALYKNIRKPNYLMELLKIINQNLNYKMNMYSFGDGQEILEGYKKEFQDKLVLHGKVSFNEAQKAISNADILISIGNTIKNQTPSKVFEYLSFGKPIIHIYSNDDDLVVDTLKKYPLSLCLKEDMNCVVENAQKLLEFCKIYTGKEFSFEQCSEIYYDATPEYIANQFDKYIYKR
ncbi:glycosyltransferase [Bacillus wiedmannii]|uniref:glycosyltransferase n=1 Tax=Bacillus wiedmannii TaxID=1890302 RepID=UPI0012459A11|nr:glycosyltransferase [Bacillus wiedmannii]